MHVKHSAPYLAVTRRELEDSADLQGHFCIYLKEEMQARMNFAIL